MSQPGVIADGSSTALPLTRRLLAGALGIGAGAFLLLGSVLPWLGGPDADRVVYGDTTADGRPALGSRLGLEGGDARLTLGIGVLVLALVALLLLRRARTAYRVTLGAASALALVWAVLDTAEAGDRLDVSAGPGLWLVTLGALLGLGAAALSPTDADQWYDVRSARAVSMFSSGRPADAIALQQRIVRASVRSVGWSDVYTVQSALQLARMHAGIGAGAVAHRLLGDVMGRCTPLLAADDLEVARDSADQVLAMLGIAAPPR